MRQPEKPSTATVPRAIVVHNILEPSSARSGPCQAAEGVLLGWESPLGHLARNLDQAGVEEVLVLTNDRDDDVLRAVEASRRPTSPLSLRLHARWESGLLGTAVVYLCEARILDSIPAGADQDFEEHLIGRLIEVGERVFVHRCAGEVRPLQSAGDYVHLQRQLLADGTIHQHGTIHKRSAEAGKREVAERVWIGERVLLSEDAEIRGPVPAILGSSGAAPLPGPGAEPEVPVGAP